MMRRYLSQIALFCLVILSVSSMCRAQSAESAALGGVVEDKSGAVIPNVEVKVTSVDSGVTRRVTTNHDGSFQVPGLLPGNYVVHLQHSGFADVEVTGIKLEVAGNRQLEIKLPVGKEQQTVTVVAGSVGINTTDASVSTVIDQQLISELPMNGRSLDTLFLLTPGVVSSGTQNAGGQYSVNGQRSSGNNLTVDGASGNIYLSSQGYGSSIGSAQTGLAGSTYATSASGGTNGLLPVDAIEEYRIQTSTYSAEYGRSPGGQIQMRTRGGTNRFHGSAFEYFRNQVMDATDWFVKYDGLKQAPLRMNDFGGTFGGPIMKNRLFFFGAHETLFLDQPNNVSTEVPSAYAKQIVGSTFAPFLAAYPNGNGGTATTAKYPQYTDIYNEAYATKIVDHTTSVRLDADLARDYKLFFRFNLAPSSSQATLWSGSNGALNLSTYTFGATKSISSSLLDEVTINYSKNGANFTYNPLAIDGASPSGFNQFCATTAYSPVGSSRCYFYGLKGWGTPYEGSSLAANLGQWNFAEKMHWTVGRHAFSFGTDFRRLSTSFAPYTVDGIYVGYYNSPSAFSTAIIDQVTTESSVLNKDLVFPVYNLSLFGQDDWHVTNRLTINYGLRWEYNPPVSDGHGGPLAVTGNVGNLSSLTPAPAYTPLYKTDYKAFAPRLGIAYQLQNRQGFATVVRAGAGVFYDTGQAASAASEEESTYPYVINASVKNVPFNQLSFQQIQQSVPAQTLPQGGLYIVDPNLTLPYTAEWNVALEQELFGNTTISATYLGADGQKLASTIQSYGISPALVTSIGSLQLLTNRGLSNYQAFQLQATTRTKSGIDGVVAYTYSHNIDNGSSDFTGSLIDSTNYRASADYDIRHAFSAGVSVKSKGLSINRLAKIATNGWVVNTFIRLQTASPISVFAQNYDATPAEENSISGFADRVSGVPVYRHGPLGANGKLILGGIQLNPAAFTDPPEAADGSFLRDGNSGRNTYRLFGIHEFDLSAGRRFALTERVGFEFKAEAFNIINTPNFTNVSNYVDGANFGQAQNTYAGYNGASGGGLNTVFQIGGPRNLQLTARISF